MENMHYPESSDFEATQRLIKVLDRAHDPAVAKIRGRFFEAENEYFRKHINNSKVECYGCGLGHEAIELAHYNRRVIGMDINPALVEEANRRTFDIRRKGELPIRFTVDDMLFELRLDEPLERLDDHVVLNMGTICNFDNDSQVKIVRNALREAKHFHFSFYQDNLYADKRVEMYKEEGWGDVQMDTKQKAIVSKDGFYSRLLSIDDIHMRVMEAHPDNVLEIHRLGEFGLMAHVYREDEQ